MESDKDGEMETVAGGLPLPIPEGPFFDVLSRLSIKDLHRSTSLSRDWRDVFIKFPDSRKKLPQTLQGFFYIGYDCKRHGRGGDDGDSDDGNGDGTRGDDGSGNSNGNGSGGGGSESSDTDTDDEDGDGKCKCNSDGYSYYGGHVVVGNDSRDDGDDNDGNGGGGDDVGRGCDDGGDGSGTDEDGDGSNDRDEDEDDSGDSSDGISSYDGGHVGNGGGDDGEVGRGRDSACSGNYRLRFLDLLAKSMPVPVDTDTEFSFIPLPDHVDLLCSCNGLLLFGCKEGSESYHSQGYIVCNPATKQWVTVPSSGWVLLNDDDDEHNKELESTFLFFDPAAVPSRFLLIQFMHDEDGVINLIGDGEGAVHIYSSETGKWSNRSSEWMLPFARGGEWVDGFGVTVKSWLGSSFLNGMLHFLVERGQKDDVLIVAMDGEGSIRRITPWPLDTFTEAVLIGQSQGRLHCISENIPFANEDLRKRIIMTVHVLQDYDAEEWQITSKFGILGGDLSGGGECRREDYEVVAFHPDGDLVYFVDRRKRELIQYDMGGNYREKEQVLRLCTLGHNCRAVTPYVPCFSRPSALDTNEASENPV